MSAQSFCASDRAGRAKPVISSNAPSVSIFAANKGLLFVIRGLKCVFMALFLSFLSEFVIAA
jgi:hypothetical protein